MSWSIWVAVERVDPRLKLSRSLTALTFSETIEERFLSSAPPTLVLIPVFCDWRFIRVRGRIPTPDSSALIREACHVIAPPCRGGEGSSRRLIGKSSEYAITNSFKLSRRIFDSNCNELCGGMRRFLDPLCHPVSSSGTGKAKTRGLGHFSTGTLPAGVKNVRTAFGRIAQKLYNFFRSSEGFSKD